jgi:hypothetical protein
MLLLLLLLPPSYHAFAMQMLAFITPVLLLLA